MASFLCYERGCADAPLCLSYPLLSAFTGNSPSFGDISFCKNLPGLCHSHCPSLCSPSFCSVLDGNGVFSFVSTDQPSHLPSADHPGPLKMDVSGTGSHSLNSKHAFKFWACDLQYLTYAQGAGLLPLALLLRHSAALTAR